MGEYITVSPATWRGQTQRTPSSLTLVSFHVHTRGSADPAHVNSVPLCSLESPVVTVALSDILVAVGEAAALACASSGTPQPEIWWYKGGPTNCSHK